MTFKQFSECVLWSQGSLLLEYITKTCLYNFDPLKPNFYKVKLGFTGVYTIFFISVQKHRLWVLVRTASARRFYRVPTIGEAVLTSTHNLCFEQKYKKYQNLLSEKLPFFGGKIFSVFEEACFRNVLYLKFSWCGGRKMSHHISLYSELYILPASVAQLYARPTGDQEDAGLTPAGSPHFFRGD